MEGKGRRGGGCQQRALSDQPVSDRKPTLRGGEGLLQKSWRRKKEEGPVSRVAVRLVSTVDCSIHTTTEVRWSDGDIGRIADVDAVEGHPSSPVFLIEFQTSST